MKNKILKFGILSVAIMTCSLSISSVNAAENCKTYTDYYFFLNSSRIANITDDTHEVKGGDTYYNPIDTTKYQINGTPTFGNVTLKDDCSTSKTTSCWTFNDFYEKLKAIKSYQNEGKISVSGTNYEYVWIEEGTTKYYVHKTWSDTGNIKDSDIVGLASNNEITDLLTNTCKSNGCLRTASGTFENDYFHIKINNGNVTKSELNQMNQNKVLESKSESSSGLALFPALAYVTYEVCDKEDEPTTPKYNVTIEYECQDLNGNVMTCPGGNPKAHKETGKEDGSSVNVTSPTIDNCETKSKEVVGKIEGKDFYKKVIYKCNPKLDDSPSNPGTGDALIITAWVIGIGSLGYATYYFYNLKKSKSEN